MKVSKIITYFVLFVLAIVSVIGGIYLLTSKMKHSTSFNANYVDENETILSNESSGQNINLITVNSSVNKNSNTNVNLNKNINVGVNFNNNVNTAINQNINNSSLGDGQGYYQNKAKDIPVDWQIYSNDQVGFSLKYPPNWQAKFSSFQESSRFNLLITLNDSASLTIARLETGFEGSTTIDETEVTIDGIPAIRQVLQSIDNSNDLNVLVYPFQNQEDKFQSMFIYYSLNQPETAEVYEKIVGTIDFY